MHREIEVDDVVRMLAAYDCHFIAENGILSLDNRCFWSQNTIASEA